MGNGGNRMKSFKTQLRYWRKKEWQWEIEEELRRIKYDNKKMLKQLKINRIFEIIWIFLFIVTILVNLLGWYR